MLQCAVNYVISPVIPSHDRIDYSTYAHFCDNEYTSIMILLLLHHSQLLHA